MAAPDEPGCWGGVNFADQGVHLAEGLREDGIRCLRAAMVVATCSDFRNESSLLLWMTASSTRCAARPSR
eukprot:3111762-Pyramimonas_sp.AAC.1